MSAYLTRLICAAILCALVDALCGSRGGIRRLTAAVFLTLVAFSLPVELEPAQLQPGRFLEQARAAAADGENMARDARAEIIIEAAEAYICTKAEAMGLRVQAAVKLDDELRPCRAELTGAASPLERRTLTQQLVQELGLEEGDLVWKESYQSGA